MFSKAKSRNAELKIFFYTVLLLGLFIPVNTGKAQETPEYHDLIKDYDGIPINAPLHKDWITGNHQQVKLMKEAGVDFVLMGVTDQWVVDSLKSLGLKLLAFQSFDYNWVQYYTDAKYSVWEADAPSGNGDAHLYRNQTKTTKIADSYIRLNNQYANDTCKMIWGPYYIQDVAYYTKSLNGTYDAVEYTTDFQLKLEDIGPDTANASTPLCIIQTTQSSCSSLNHIDCTYIIAADTLTRSRFTQLNQFKKFPLTDYTLENDSCYGSSGSQFPQPMTNRMTGSGDEYSTPFVSTRQYVEYNVIWLGHPSYVLSIDSIVVSDLRGRELIPLSPFAEQRILAQADAFNNLAYTDSVVGWIGFDEPASIDLYEPIRIVTNILDDYTQERRSVWLPWRAFWDGAYESRGNNLGAMGLIPWEEFAKRTDRINLTQNSYLFDLPCNESNSNLTPCMGDYRVINIWRFANLLYKPAYELDPHWGASIQCGEVDPPYPNSYQRDIRSHEFLYTANLALMYGAKFLSLYTYFAQEPYLNHTFYTYRAIVEFPNYPITNAELTDKYYTLRDTLSPRLKGLFGKTLKKLIATDQYLNIDALIDPQNAPATYNYVEYIETTGGPNDECFVDLGFFEDSQDPSLNYFMPVNRYYSNKYHLTFGLQNLTSYVNWQIYDYVDTTGFTVLPNNGKVEFSEDIYPGDAKLYSVLPVIKYGGTLISDETAGEGGTLKGDMTIDNGAALSIYQNYYAQGDIIIKNGSIENYDPNSSGTIHFQNGHKLIIEGTATINGTSGNNLTLDFTEDSSGIVIKSGGSLNISYCDIQYPAIGIESELNANYLSAQYINFSNCGTSSIEIVGKSSGDGASTPPPSQIKYCTMTSSEWGISASNVPELIIKGNTISNTTTAATYISQITKVSVIDNTINNYSYNNVLFGIFINSSGGSVIGNSISNQYQGIYLANSSNVDIGGNDITGCKNSGLYIA